MKRRPPIVEIAFHDSVQSVGWKTKAEQKAWFESACICRVAGFLVDAKHGYYTVSSAVEKGGKVAGLFSVPRAAVVSIKTLRKRSKW